MPEAVRRKLWLDWQRGFAVLCMVTWHTWDSWRSDAVAVGPVHDVVNLIGGVAAPSFLYMAGLSQFLGDASLARKGTPTAARRSRALRRGLWLLAVAYLFRIAEYVLGGAYRVPGGWQGIFKVDVLNVIAVSFLISALFTVGVERRLQIALATVAAAMVVFLSPPVAAWQHAPSRLLDYAYCEWPRGIFYLFPWAAFCFAGSALGALAAGKSRPSLWLALGAALFVAGWASDHLPPLYAHQDFWHSSPSWFAVRLGVVVATSGALQLVPEAGDRWLAWLRLLGRHSLLGYFVSVEIPYGVLTHSLHKRLGVVTVVLGIVLMTALTWAASRFAERYDGWKAGRDRSAAGPLAPA